MVWRSVTGRLLGAAGAFDHELDHLVDVVLAQALGALVEVRLDLVRVGTGHLTVEVLEHPQQRLRTLERAGLPRVLVPALGAASVRAHAPVSAR